MLYFLISSVFALKSTPVESSASIHPKGNLISLGQHYSFKVTLCYDVFFLLSQVEALYNSLFYQPLSCKWSVATLFIGFNII